MKILFLTLLNFNPADNGNPIYSDLLAEFVRNGHEVYIVQPCERRDGGVTSIAEFSGFKVLSVGIGNIQKCNLIEKGLTTLTLTGKYRRAIKRHFGNIRFDMVLYTTPPVTLAGVIKAEKKRNKAFCYLILKDIFPQNAVDLGMLKKHGIRAVPYRYFRYQEKKLYALSDFIGCMSGANRTYLLEHNESINPRCVNICPNSAYIQPFEKDGESRRAAREKYGIPQDKTVLIYGGNIGKPQNVDFIARCIGNAARDDSLFFVIVGAGTGYASLKTYVGQSGLSNCLMLNMLPRPTYEKLVAACDIGLIFLDYRFSIPNFPSRLLSYLQAGIPILAATDRTSDVGDFLEEHAIGVKCPSDNPESFYQAVQRIKGMSVMPDDVLAVFREHFDVKYSYDAIMEGYNSHEDYNQ